MNTTWQDVAERAYARWTGNGRPHNTDLEDWCEAEDEVNRLRNQAHQLAEKAAPESGQLLHALLANSPAVIYVKDLQGRYLLINPHYETLFRVTQQQIVGKTSYDLFPAEIADALRANDLRVLAAETPLEFEEVVPQEDGLHTYISLKFPIRGPTGVPYAVCGISTDITAREQARGRLLAEHAVTRVLAGSPALEQAVPGVLRAVCECLGWEMGIFWGVDTQANVLRCVEVWHAPAVEISTFHRLNGQTTFAPNEGLPGRIWASGRHGWSANAATDSDCPRMRAGVQEGMHRNYGFPVRNGGDILGVLEFFSGATHDPNEDVREMMAHIGSQMSQFIERRHAEKALHERERELGLARAIQQRRLPRVAPGLAGFDIGGASRPAQETGGDYLDFIPMSDGCLGIAIGDASGHGIAAALLMAETRAYLRALARIDSDVGRALTLVNRHVAEDTGDEFVTMFLGRLDPRACSLVYTNGGHWPGYILDWRGEVKRVLGSTGLPLGVDAEATIPGAEPFTLELGELVLLLTDGVVEAFSPDNTLFGIERVLSNVRAHRDATADEIVTSLLDEVLAFSQGSQVDDMTAVVIKVGQT